MILTFVADTAVLADAIAATVETGVLQLPMCAESPVSEVDGSKIFTGQRDVYDSLAIVVVQMSDLFSTQRALLGTMAHQSSSTTSIPAQNWQRSQRVGSTRFSH